MTKMNDVSEEMIARYQALTDGAPPEDEDSLLKRFPALAGARVV